MKKHNSFNDFVLAKKAIVITNATETENGFVAYRSAINGDVKRVSIAKISLSGRNYGIVGYVNPSGEIMAPEAIYKLINSGKLEEVLNAFPVNELLS